MTTINENKPVPGLFTLIIDDGGQQ